MDVLYETNWNKYNNIEHYQQCCSLLNDFYKKFHNCSILMLHKKQLEKKVRKYKNIQ